MSEKSSIKMTIMESLTQDIQSIQENPDIKVSVKYRQTTH